MSDDEVPNPYLEVYIPVSVDFGHNQIVELAVRGWTKVPTHFFIGLVIENFMPMLYILSGLIL
ncbi:hypothetical protein [Desulfosarcina sp.]|uniref:hypothetical protein n=1 Tax=Desulfosarcina sp. TaxID=2027861 RepID=UPI0035635ED5